MRKKERERERERKERERALTRAGGISDLSLLTNMSFHSALRRDGLEESAPAIACAAWTPMLFPLSLRVVSSFSSFMAFTVSSTGQEERKKAFLGTC